MFIFLFMVLKFKIMFIIPKDFFFIFQILNFLLKKIFMQDFESYQSDEYLNMKFSAISTDKFSFYYESLSFVVNFKTEKKVKTDEIELFDKTIDRNIIDNKNNLLITKDDKLEVEFKYNDEIASIGWLSKENNFLKDENIKLNFYCELIIDNIKRFLNQNLLQKNILIKTK